jgi:6-phosphogluconolactonase
MRIVKVVSDSSTLATAAADLFIAKAQAAIDRGNRFTVALSGGNTPRELYSRLATPDLASRVKWEAVHLFWGDERCVPPDHPDSNYRMVSETFLSKVPIPTVNIHRIHGELISDQAAIQYENELRTFFGDSPRFDLVLLGLGDDGHTASLFPSSPALHERNHWAVPVPHATPPPPFIPRVTLTPVAINSARQVVFLVSGGTKARRLAEVLEIPSSFPTLPAQMIQPEQGELLWLIDKSAADSIHAEKNG